MILFIVITCLSLLDAILTDRILARGGRELNPLLAYAMRLFGVRPALFAFKGGSLATILAADWYFDLGWVMGLIVTFYAALCLWNILQYRRLP